MDPVDALVEKLPLSLLGLWAAVTFLVVRGVNRRVRALAAVHGEHRVGMFGDVVPLGYALA